MELAASVGVYSEFELYHDCGPLKDNGIMVSAVKVKDCRSFYECASYCELSAAA